MGACVLHLRCFKLGGYDSICLLWLRLFVMAWWRSKVCNGQVRKHTINFCVAVPQSPQSGESQQIVRRHPAIYRFTRRVWREADQLGFTRHRLDWLVKLGVLAWPWERSCSLALPPLAPTKWLSCLQPSSPPLLGTFILSPSPTPPPPLAPPT